MVVATAIGGENVSETVEGRERYPINVRYAREFRDDPGAARPHPRSRRRAARRSRSRRSPTIRSVLGPPMIRSEGGKLVGFVFVDTDRPIADYVADAKRGGRARGQLPTGVRLDVGRAVHSTSSARRRAWSWVIPLTLAIVFLLLYLNTRSMVGDRHRDARGAVLADRRGLVAVPAATTTSASRCGSA